MVKVHHSLVAVGAVGGRGSPYLVAQHMEGGAHPTHFAALSFHDSKKVPIYCWVDRESLESLDGPTRV